MTSGTPIEMTNEERDAFLGEGGTGVVAFPTDDVGPPHAIPVSYGYDAAEETFYFRLAIGTDSRKGEPDGQQISFVVHGQGDDDGPWRSVVASGRLERTVDESIATETLQGLERVRIPLFDVFGKPPGEVDFGFYRLVPEELTGRKESRTSP